MKVDTTAPDRLLYWLEGPMKLLNAGKVITEAMIPLCCR